MTAFRSATHVDPRGPFVLDTRELGRRAGSMLRVRRTVAAPEEWHLELVRVPAGADVELDLRLEAVMEGVLVSGTVHAPVAADCGRCLQPVTDELTADVQELFGYEPDPGDADLPVLNGDFIDAEPLFRDAVVLALPLNPVCDDDCAGLCSGCGEPWADLDDDHTHDHTDARWAPLAALHQTNDPSGDRPAEPEMES